MTLRQDLKECRAKLAACRTASAAKDATIQDLKYNNTNLLAQIAALSNEAADLTSQVATLTSANAALNTQIADKNTLISDLQKQLDDCVGGGSDFLVMPAGASPQAFLTSAGNGAKIQLPAALKLNSTLTPLPGQHIRGPCVITPTSGTDISLGINCKSKMAKGAILENLDVSGFVLRGLVPWEGIVVKGGRYHHNGEMGIGCDMQGAIHEVITLDGVEVDHNGSDEFIGHGAAGVKFFHTYKTKLINVNSHDNIGNGIWWDAESGYAEVIGGTVTANVMKGVFWEKCGGNHGEGYVNPSGTPYAGGGVPYDGLLTVDGVVIRDNNPSGPRFSLQSNAGVFIPASKNAVVKNCTFGGNTNAIVVRNDYARIADDHPGWLVSNVTIDDSTNTYNGDKIVIGGDVGTGVIRT